jgi:hypothetical protein
MIVMIVKKKIYNDDVMSFLFISGGEPITINQRRTKNETL